MANPAVLVTDTTLYSPAEPDGRPFPAGTEWPGDAWSANRGGDPVGKDATAQAMMDLIDAQDRLDALSAQMDRQTHSLAQVSAARDAAVSATADLEQRAIAAEAAQKTAEDAARGYMTERDAARADAKRFSDLVDTYRPEVEKVAGLVDSLNAANQTIADLNDKLAAAAKPKKAAKDAGAAPQDAAEPPAAT